MKKKYNLFKNPKTSLKILINEAKIEAGPPQKNRTTYAMEYEHNERIDEISKPVIQALDTFTEIAKIFSSDIKEVLEPNYRHGENIIGDTLKDKLGEEKLKEVLNLLKEGGEIL